jgi:hypothetical protein
MQVLTSTPAVIRGIVDILERDQAQGIEGTEWTRRALRTVRRVERCRRSTARLERVVDGRREAMMMPLPCGSRMCQDCGRGLRDRARDRMERGNPEEPGFQWRTVITLTMRYGDVDGEWAWSRIGSWVSRFLSSMKQWQKKYRPWMCDFPQSYAWVLEQTKRGWPHVHIILARPCGSRWAESEFHKWACQRWERLTGCYVSRGFVLKKDGIWHGKGVDIQPVKSHVAAAKYLSLYLSKSYLDKWHYAVLGRKRIWSTSKDIPAEKRESTGWRLERVLEEVDNPCEDPDAWARMEEGGWVPLWETDSGVALWVREEARQGPDCRWMEALDGSIDWTGPPEPRYAR